MATCWRKAWMTDSSTAASNILQQWIGLIWDRICRIITSTKLMSQENNKYHVLLKMIRGSRKCKDEADDFSLSQSTVAGKVEPSILKEKAIRLLDCYAKNSDNSDANRRELFNSAFTCLSQKGYCANEIEAYASS